MPTLLAYLGKEQETDCWGFMVNVDWSRGGAHPRTYEPEDIDADRCALSAIFAASIQIKAHYSGLGRLS